MFTAAWHSQPESVLFFNLDLSCYPHGKKLWQWLFHSKNLTNSAVFLLLWPNSFRNFLAFLSCDLGFEPNPNLIKNVSSAELERWPNYHVKNRLFWLLGWAFLNFCPRSTEVQYWKTERKLMSEPLTIFLISSVVKS